MQFVVYHLFVVLFTILVLFFIYRGGDEQALRLNRVLRDAIGDSAAPYLDLAIQAVRATVIGMVAVALFDGVLTGIIYAVAGVQHAAVWGAVTGLFAMIPYLGYVAVVGVALSLAAKGAVAPALAVCVLGCIVHFVGRQDPPSRSGRRCGQARFCLGPDGEPRRPRGDGVARGAGRTGRARVGQLAVAGVGEEPRTLVS